MCANLASLAMQASSVIWPQCSIWCASLWSGCHSTSEGTAVLLPSLSCSASCPSARRPALCESPLFRLAQQQTSNWQCAHAPRLHVCCRGIRLSLLTTAKAILTLLEDSDAALGAAAYTDVVDLTCGEPRLGFVLPQMVLSPLTAHGCCSCVQTSMRPFGTSPCQGWSPLVPSL